MSTKNILNANQKKSEFIKLVGDEFSNQINSSNNRNSCLVIQSEAMKKNEYEFQKFSKEKDENGKETAVAKSSDTKLAMEYVQLIPVLVKAVQELSAKVTALENA